MVKLGNLSFQKRIAASIMRCGKKRVWFEPNELSEICTANSRQMMRKLINDGFVAKKAIAIHSRARARAMAAAKRKGRHTGYGKRRGTRDARFPAKVMWMRRMRVLRNLLARYRSQDKVDKHLYRELYAKVKGNWFKHRRALREFIFEAKEERARQAQEEADARARLERARRKRAAKAARSAKKEQERVAKAIAATKTRSE